MGSWIQTAASSHGHITILHSALRGAIPRDTYRVKVTCWTLHGKDEFTLTEDTSLSEHQEYGPTYKPSPKTYEAAKRYCEKRDKNNLRMEPYLRRVVFPHKRCKQVGTHLTAPPLPPRKVKAEETTQAPENIQSAWTDMPPIADVTCKLENLTM